MLIESHIGPWRVIEADRGLQRLIDPMMHFNIRSSFPGVKMDITLLFLRLLQEQVSLCLRRCHVNNSMLTVCRSGNLSVTYIKLVISLHST